MSVRDNSGEALSASALRALVASLRALMEKATPGPWIVVIRRATEFAHAIQKPGVGTLAVVHHEADSYFADPTGEANAALIVAAVNALPALLSSPEAGAGEPVAWGILDRERRVIQSAPTEVQARETAEMYDEDFAGGAPHTVAPLYLATLRADAGRGA